MKKYITFIAIVIGLSSCWDDINDVKPADSLEVSDFYSSLEDFNASLGGAMQQLQNYYALELLIMGDIPTDNVIQVTSGRFSSDVYWDWRYSSLNDIGLLDEGYEAVNIANSIIANIDALPDGNEKDNIRGQAIAVRALAHFDMVRVYGRIPTESASAGASLGLPYLRFEDGDTGNPFAQPARETVDSNYGDIVADLLAARDLVNATSVENRFTVEAINGLLSRVYLYMGQYQNAIDAADLVTSAPADADVLLSVFQDNSNDGILMKLAVDFGSGDALSPGVVWSQSSATATVSEYAIAYDFYTSLAADDTRDSTYVFLGTNQGSNYNAIRKWLGEGNQVNGVKDMPVIRVEEVILNKAEAQFELSQAGAETTLNELRDVRYGAYAGGETGAALESAIRFERRIELFAEYSRWFDLRRWGLGVNRGNFGDVADGSGTVPENLTLAPGADEFLLPIPLTEIQANPNFEQNPGYASE
ncbi:MULTISPECIES: RagB/SusD family nutrient uptake outer membrane protein [unclassified Ekhidna]|jgi:hypothetical protein|uniref:RagB/SusD family nutrient uptake outer membrane protein n=1 Tax=unclassified Ekhidna TaxID=2632188 RepID=UPI0032DEFF1D